MKIRFLKTLLIGGGILCSLLSNAQTVVPLQIFDDSVLGGHTTKAPHRPVYVTLDGNTLTLPVMSDDLILELRDDNGERFFQVEEGVSTAQFRVPSGSYNVCVTKPGYIPYMTTAYFSGSAYVQNETFTTDTYINGDWVKVGSNVTTSKPQGSVYVTSGKTTIQSPNSVTVKNDFKVSLGAELKISAGE